MEGRRPLLAEVQALVTPSPLERPAAHDLRPRLRPGSRWCWPCSSSTAASGCTPHDVFASTVGGARLTEPASDLAVAVALASAARRRPRRRPAWSRWARSGWPASCAGSATCRSGWPRRPGWASQMAVVPGRAGRGAGARAPEPATGRRDAGARGARRRARRCGCCTSTGAPSRSASRSDRPERLRSPTAVDCAATGRGHGRRGRATERSDETAAPARDPRVDRPRHRRCATASSASCAAAPAP